MSQSLILGAVLLLVNGGLIISRICKKNDEAKQLDELWKQKQEKEKEKQKQEKEKQEEEESEEEKQEKEKQEKEELKDEIEPKQIYPWIVGIVICLDVLIIGAIVTHWWAETYFDRVSDTDNQKALFGDSFGAVNALVSALAFAGMIVAFVLQRYELRLQRKELKDNRAEMTQQTSQFVAENKNLEIQRFENLFYNMLNLQQKIVDGLRYDYYDQEYVTVALGEGRSTQDTKSIKREVVGRDVFRYLFNDAPMSFYTESGAKDVYGYRRFLFHKGLGEYDSTLIPSYFDHYFRHLYKIVQFVDSKEVSHSLTFDEAYRYLSYVRGTLSRYELVWLYYNALYPDFYKFKKLIEKYSILKALRNDLLTITKETARYYKGLGVDEQTLNKTDFGYNDFCFYLTDDPKEETKYLISAFWNHEDYQGGIDYLEKWRGFINEKTDQLVEKVDTPVS